MKNIMKKIILLSGTPGTGKTTIVKLLKSALPAVVIDINKEVIENQFFTMDSERETKIADFKKLKPYLEQKIKEIQSEYILIEGHYADIMPNELVSKIIILRTHPEVLKKRLKQKNYSTKKIIENLQAEILGTCSYHAIKSFETKKIYELDNSELTIEETVKKIVNLIKENMNRSSIGKIDWLDSLEKTGRLSKYFD